MSRSTDPGHFFQTTTALSESARKAEKSKNKNGKPTKLASKILAIAPDLEHGGQVYLAEAAGTVRRIVLETGENSAVFTGPAAPVTSLAFSAGTVYAGCWDKTIWSWSTETRRLVRKFVGHSDFVKALVTVNLDGREIIVSGGADVKIIAWDIVTGKELYTLKGHSRGILHLAIDPMTLPAQGAGQSKIEDTAVLWSAGSDREIRRWKLFADRGQEIPFEVSGNIDPILLSHDTSVNALHFEADEEDCDLWTASSDKSAKCLSRVRNWEVDTTLQHPDFVRAVVVDTEGGYVITACRDEEVRVWDKGSGKLIHTFTGHFEEVTGLCIVGRKLVSVSIDATVRQWSLRLEDLKKAIEEAEREKEGEEVKPEEKKEPTLTEEEERELAELMDSDDD